MSEMEAKGIQVKQETEEADVLIVQTAISRAGTLKVSSENVSLPEKISIFGFADFVSPKRTF